jgi:hypothetical protein
MLFHLKDGTKETWNTNFTEQIIVYNQEFIGMEIMQSDI